MIAEPGQPPKRQDSAVRLSENNPHFLGLTSRRAPPAVARESRKCNYCDSLLAAAWTQQAPARQCGRRSLPPRGHVVNQSQVREAKISGEKAHGKADATPASIDRNEGSVLHQMINIDQARPYTDIERPWEFFTFVRQSGFIALYLSKTASHASLQHHTDNYLPLQRRPGGVRRT